MNNMSADRVSLVVTGLKTLREDGVASAGPFTVRLEGKPDTEKTVQSFECLLDAITWLTQTMEDGGWGQQAGVYSANEKLVWTALPGRSAHLRDNTIRQNAQRLLMQAVGLQDILEEVGVGEFPIAPR
jgi:hypothetical protein